MERIRHGRLGKEWRGAVWRGQAPQAGSGQSGLGAAGHGTAGEAGRGKPMRGAAPQARHGWARPAADRLAELGVVAHQRGRDFLPPTLFLI
jgi:hypothetical protein